MKKNILIILAIGLMLTGCTKQSAVPVQKIKPVSTEIIATSSRPIALSYDGVAANTSVIQYAFYQNGEIEKINVSAGDIFNKDDVLATLSVSGADAPVELAAKDDGVALSILNKEGDAIEQGYPVILARPRAVYIAIGVTSEDLDKITTETEVFALAENGTVYEAEVFNISRVPDETTRTYPVTLKIESGESINLGTTLTVTFKLEDNKGIWLPIAGIENDGSAYVYIVEEGRAKRVDISILNSNEAFAKISGLQEGDELITSGANTLTDGYKVEVISLGDDDE